MAAYDFNEVSLTFNEHHSNYQTAKEHIEENAAYYADVDPTEVEDMKKHDCIWTLQIYDKTPVGSYIWHASTMDDVIDQARKHFQLEEWRLKREKIND